MAVFCRLWLQARSGKSPSPPTTIGRCPQDATVSQSIEKLLRPLAVKSIMVDAHIHLRDSCASAVVDKVRADEALGCIGMHGARHRLRQAQQTTQRSASLKCGPAPPPKSTTTRGFFDRIQEVRATFCVGSCDDSTFWCLRYDCHRCYRKSTACIFHELAPRHGALCLKRSK